MVSNAERRFPLVFNLLSSFSPLDSVFKPSELPRTLSNRGFPSQVSPTLRDDSSLFPESLLAYFSCTLWFDRITPVRLARALSGPSSPKSPPYARLQLPCAPNGARARAKPPPLTSCYLVFGVHFSRFFAGGKRRYSF